MKNIIFSCILLCALTIAKAQTDYCKDITRRMNQFGDFAIYESPDSFISIDTHIEISDGFKITSLGFHITKRTADYNAGGIIITFADGTVWKDERRTIDCSYISADMGYSYRAAHVIHEDDIELFKTKKIVKVQITDVEIPVDDAFATKFMAYVNCIDAIKK